MATDHQHHYQKRQGTHPQEARLSRVDPPAKIETGSPRGSVGPLELVVGSATLLLTTLASLIASPVLGALALVSGGVSYGILIARGRDRR